MEREKIMKEIEQVREQLSATTIHTCEIYSRVVGYYRPVNQWNEGKQDEWGIRSTFNVSLENL